MNRIGTTGGAGQLRRKSRGVVLSGMSWMAALCWVLTLLLPAGAQEVGMMQSVGGVPVTFTYSSWEIRNYQQPDEIHLISGSPAGATVELESGVMKLRANYLTYSNQDAIISATSGVMISDGTLEIKANRGTFDIRARKARFEQGVEWRRKAGDQISWGSMEYILVDMGESGIENIHMGGSPGRPGRMNLVGEEGMFGPILSVGKPPSRETGEKPEAPREVRGEQAPLIPPIDRATSGLVR